MLINNHITYKMPYARRSFHSHRSYARPTGRAQRYRRAPARRSYARPAFRRAARRPVYRRVAQRRR